MQMRVYPFTRVIFLGQDVKERREEKREAYRKK
jgi:hypothetical protein